MRGKAMLKAFGTRTPSEVAFDSVKAKEQSVEA